ncbi:MAG: NIF family HAD-type phosphatase [Rhodospirillales bacterium]|jgi:hydroxymethylpyrimidine pyrophosphatase-like HAD family hydrolase|nr:NIF family HAD-type phosphatase [Rhodospirillales bacterium]HIJ42408.1 DUF705 domain-containing protein [Rhodospirillaceae bacterium]MDP7214833.1 NIF family HAD-type phosphatase [Rhodospirillales bacterium]HIJ44550.1 DUF705 domain-containing protein [Rhodospirillaceae bacterium]HIJ91878.1 DUF705 domain-containing protein [Rhodospirillaceae bacterium]
MIVVFDLDNTLTDEAGRKLRPGITALLEKLNAKGYELALWTQSPRARARAVLKDHGLERHFGCFVFREDYDPENRDPPKDIRGISGGFLVDDNPAHVNFVHRLGLGGFLVAPYRGSPYTNTSELVRLYRRVRAARWRQRLLGGT